MELNTPSAEIEQEVPSAPELSVEHAALFRAMIGAGVAAGRKKSKTSLSRLAR
jgi:hypothetical protein